MNYYPHHIGDFNNATRHLTRVERALYRELIELYYDTEKPLPAGDLPGLCRRVMASSASDQAAVKNILREFFTLEGDVYRHARCDKEISVYREKLAIASRAGKASAERRLNGRSTGVEQASNQPITNNQEPRTNKKIRASAAAPDLTPVLEKLPLRNGGEFEVHQSLVAELEPLYPNVDVPATLKEMRGWLLLNEGRRKTRQGVKAFIGRWLQTEQEKHGG